MCASAASAASAINNFNDLAISKACRTSAEQNACVRPASTVRPPSVRQFRAALTQSIDSNGVILSGRAA